WSWPSRPTRRARTSSGRWTCCSTRSCPRSGEPPPRREANMRRLILWNVQTLDGYFEGAKPWDLDFHNTAWGDELEQLSRDQAKEVGAVLYGRATYEGMQSYWTTASG